MKLTEIQDNWAATKALRLATLNAADTTPRYTHQELRNTP